MKESIKRLFSLIFIIVLLLKSLSSLSPLFASTINDTFLTELQTETEQENKKKSRTIEIESIEDFFEKIHCCYGDPWSFISSPKWMMHGDQSLQWVHLDTLTPPPDIV